jgi:hypothetical protein
VSSSTLATVFTVHVDTPSCPESLGGTESVKLRRGSADMHGVSMRWAEVENLLSSRLDEGAQGV